MNERRVHQSLVASHEESRRWHGEAMRVLAQARTGFAPCESGPCDGGTKLCPSPQACRLQADRVDRLRQARADADLPWPLIVRVVLIVAVSALGFWLVKR